MQMSILGHGSEWSVYRVSDWPEMAHKSRLISVMELMRCMISLK